MCYVLSVDFVFSPAQQWEQNIPFPKRGTCFISGDIVPVHKFAVKEREA